MDLKPSKKRILTRLLRDAQEDKCQEKIPLNLRFRFSESVLSAFNFCKLLFKNINLKLLLTHIQNNQNSF